MMSSVLKSIILAGLLVQAGAAIAQETADPAPAEEEATEQTGTPEDLSLGEPVPPSVGEVYVLQEFGDWEMRCVKAPQGQKDPCNLYQLLLDKDGNQVAEVNLFRLPEGSRAAAGATIVVPLETLLTQQLTLSVDGSEPRRYPFTFCNAAGCVSRLGFTQAEVDQFKRGNRAVLRLVPAAAPDQEVLLDMSLSGFTAGFEGVVTPQ